MTSNPNIAKLARWPILGEPGAYYVLTRPLTMIGMQEILVDIHENIGPRWRIEEAGLGIHFSLYSVDSKDRDRQYRRRAYQIVVLTRTKSILVKKSSYPKPRDDSDAAKILALNLLDVGRIGIDDTKARDIDMSAKGWRSEFGPPEMPVNLELYRLLGLKPLLLPLSEFVPWYQGLGE